MQNYRNDGKSVTLCLPFETKTGQALVVGSLFGVLSNARGSNEQNEMWTVGSYFLPKKTISKFAVGDPVYWRQNDQDLPSSHCVNEGEKNQTDFLVGVCASLIPPQNPQGGFAEGFESWIEVRLNGVSIERTQAT